MSTGARLLEVRELEAGYGPIRVLQRISLGVDTGEIVCLLGGNAAGKSTTLKTIVGLVRPRAGHIEFAGQPIGGLPAERIARSGIALVPESRRIFARMTVRENLAMGGYTRRHAPPAETAADLDRVYALFPRLAERAGQFAGTMSGGEQQMLAIGRALMARPRLMLLDEPSMGLSPLLVEQVFGIIRAINEQGTTVLVVEQNAAVALSIAHRAYLLQEGRIVMHGAAADLLREDHIRRAYLGED